MIFCRLRFNYYVFIPVDGIAIKEKHSKSCT